MVSDGTKIIPVDANHMSAFISLCYPTDKNLLIYRGRQDAVFSFDFEQYKLYLKKFVINNPDDTSSIYRFPLPNVSPEIIVSNNLLCKQCFMLDMAQAIYKDLCLVSEQKLPASRISWNIEGCALTYVDARIECLGLYGANAKNCDGFLSIVNSNGYAEVSPNTDTTFTYGTKLSVARCAVASVLASRVPWNYES